MIQIAIYLSDVCTLCGLEPVGGWQIRHSYTEFSVFGGFRVRVRARVKKKRPPHPTGKQTEH